MRHSIILPAAALVLTAATSGCSWFKTESGYEQPVAVRPLEVPPDLDRPSTDSAMQLPGQATGSVTRSSLGAPQAAPAAAPVAASNGFVVAGSRDEVFEKVGTALAATEGLTIASKAQLLGVYDISFEGANFLVRVSQAEAGSYVSAVDPRGLPASGEAPQKLLAALKAALGG
ncbi:MAG: hypothetical protein M3Y70_04910 [Pseudomonadota bacterium]|nr:hypothetical protein [Pseudomonadota bacterium]